jgi:hypothetical protein
MILYVLSENSQGTLSNELGIFHDLFSIIDRKIIKVSIIEKSHAFSSGFEKRK